MRNIIAVISGKGGVGKTTVAVNIACGFAMLGKKCLLADCSFGVRNADIPMGMHDSCLYNLKDVIASDATPEEAVVASDGVSKPDFLSGSPSAIPDNFSQRFREIFDNNFADYDYVVIDTPSSVGAEFDACVSIADTIIAVTSEDAISVSNTSLALSRANVKSGQKAYLVLNKAEFSESDSSVFAEEILDEVGVPLVGIIREDVHVSASLVKGDPIVRYDTDAGRETENICRRLCNMHVAPSKTSLAERLFEKNKLILKQ